MAFFANFNNTIQDSKRTKTTTIVTDACKIPKLAATHTLFANKDVLRNYTSDSFSGNNSWMSFAKARVQEFRSIRSNFQVELPSESDDEMMSDAESVSSVEAEMENSPIALEVAPLKRTNSGNKKFTPSLGAGLLTIEENGSNPYGEETYYF